MNFKILVVFTKKKNIRKIISLLLVILTFSTVIACDRKDKQKVISSNVTEPSSNGKIIGFVKKVYESNGGKYLEVELVDFYRGEEGKVEAKKDGYFNDDYYDDYYLRCKKIEKTFKISDTASVNMLKIWVNPQSSESIQDGNEVVTYNQFKEYVNKCFERSKGDTDRSTLFWLTINNNEVVETSGQYTP